MNMLRMMGAVLLAASALTTTSLHAQDKTVKIGVLAPITGAAAADGNEMVNGVRLAVEEINAAGGIAGYKFDVVVGDTQDQAADTITSAFERLSGDREVNVMMTGYASGSNFEIELMAEVDMPYIIAANAAQTRDIIAPSPDDFPTIWSLSPSFDAYETAMVPVLQQLLESGKLELHNKKVALISSDNPYSRTIMEGLQKNFEGAGWEVTSADLLPFGEINDWRAFLAGVRQADPAVIINTDYLPGNAATFMTQFLEQPTKSLVFIQYAPSVPEFLELTKDRATGVIYNMLGGVLDTPQNPRAKEVVSKYTAKYGSEPGVYGPALYEQVYVYADALAKVGDAEDRLAIGKAIGETEKQISAGFLKFDPATHLAVQGEDAIPIQFYQIWDGQRTLFYPSAYATGEFQTPPWMK